VATELTELKALFFGVFGVFGAFGGSNNCCLRGLAPLREATPLRGEFSVFSVQKNPFMPFMSFMF